MSQEQDRQSIIEQEFPGWRGWLHTVANQMLPADHALHDDLAQEGLIAMWRAVGTYSDDRDIPLGAYMRYKARLRMLDIRNERGAMFGDQAAVSGGTTEVNSRGAATRARIREYLRSNPDATVREIAAALDMSPSTVSVQRKRMDVDTLKVVSTQSLDVLIEAHWEIAGDDPAVLDLILAEYAEGRIAEALDVLTPAERKYVTLRFWKGMGTGELTREFGYAPHGLWRTARERLRPVLADLMTA